MWDVFFVFDCMWLKYPMHVAMMSSDSRILWSGPMNVFWKNTANDNGADAKFVFIKLPLISKLFTGIIQYNM